MAELHDAPDHTRRERRNLAEDAVPARPKMLLRLLGRESNIDQILNIDGMGYAIIGPVILAVDWRSATSPWPAGGT